MDDSLATIIVALILSIPGMISLAKQLKKIDAEKESEEADATEKIQTAAVKMMEVYKKEVEELKITVEKHETEIAKLKKDLLSEKNTNFSLNEEKRKIIIGAWKLYDQVSQSDKTPAYTPPDTG